MRTKIKTLDCSVRNIKEQCKAIYGLGYFCLGKKCCSCKSAENQTVENALDVFLMDSTVDANFKAIEDKDINA